jgi:RNA recognition motif-containing protein
MLTSRSPARQLTQFAYGGPGPDIGTYGVDLTSQQPSPHAQARRRGLVHLSPEYSIFVGRLGPEVDESLIWSTFSPIYQSFVKANLVRSRETGESKGYAFVRFTNPVERDHALATMDGAYIGNSVIAVSNAHREDPRHAPIQATGAYLAGRQQSIHMLGGYQNGLAMLPGGGVSLPVQTGQQLHAHALAPPPTPVDPRNITVFVGGLPSGSTMEQLRRVFAPGGRIKHISIPDGKSCAFIKYSEHQEAAGAIVNLQGAPLNGARLRLAWGKHGKH